MNYSPRKSYFNKYNLLDDLSRSTEDLNITASDFIYFSSDEDVDLSKLDKHIASTHKDLSNYSTQLEDELYSDIEEDFEYSMEVYINNSDREEDAFPFSDWYSAISEINAQHHISLIKQDFLTFLKEQDVNSDLFKMNLFELLTHTEKHINTANFSQKTVGEFFHHLEKDKKLDLYSILSNSNVVDFFNSLKGLDANHKKENPPQKWLYFYIKQKINDDSHLENIESSIKKLKENGRLNDFLDYLIEDRTENLFFKTSGSFNALRNKTKRRIDEFKIENIEIFVDKFLISDYELVEFFIEKIVGRADIVKNDTTESQKNEVRRLLNKAFASKLDREMPKNTIGQQKLKI